jgi:hypothetical protein
MLPWPKALATLMSTVAPLFTKQVWQHVQLLRVGAIRAPGKRPITAAWQVMGLAHAKAFQQDHRVLNRAVWSSLRGSRLVRLLLVHLRAPRAPLGLGLDETLERRRGAQIQAQGMYRAPVRSAPSHRVNARGWRWLSLLLSVPIAWAKRGWAVPFVTVLAPSASRVVSTSCISWRWAPATAMPRGRPWPSVSRLRLVPSLLRSVGFLPTFFPPKRRLGHRPVHRLPLPLQAF